MGKIILTSLVILFSLTASAQYSTRKETIVVEGLKRFYRVYVPQKNGAKKEYPVVFVLHGGGGKASGMIRLTGGRFNELADRDGFIAVYPNGFKKGWNDSARDTLAVARRLNIDDVGYFEKMIDDLDAKFSIDRKKLFACGISNGGFMSQRLAYDLSDKFRAIAVVAANLSVAQSKKPFPENPVPVMFICGTNDPLVPYRGGHVTVLGQKRGEVLSVQESVAVWKKINGCTKMEGEFKLTDVDKSDGCTAVKTVWGNPEDPLVKVVDIKVTGGGHTWPGTKQYLPKRMIGNTNRDFNGCDEIWDFFQSIK